MTFPDLVIASCDHDDCHWSTPYPLPRDEANAELGRHVMRDHSPPAEPEPRQ